MARSTRNSSGKQLGLPPQLHANHEIVPCTLEEPLFRRSVSQESPHSVFELERVLDTLYETPEVSPDTRPHSRGTLSFSPQVKKSVIFSSSSEMRVDFPASSGKECQRPRRTSRRGWYLLDTGQESGGLVTIRKPRISPSTRDQAGYPCTDSNVSLESTHNMKEVLMLRLLI